MTALQKLTLRASEIRQRLAELAGVEEMTDEHRNEIGTLRTEYTDVEVRTQAATVAGDEPAPVETKTEDREFAALIAGADVGDIFLATVEHRATDAQTAELQQELGLASNQVPLALMRGSPVEERAVTPAPSNVGQQQAAIIPAVFPQTVAAFLGVDMPTVGVGEAVYPVLATSATAHVPAENASAADTTGSFTAEVLSPGRIQAAFFYSREDQARFAGMGEALRANLSDALADKLDDEVLTGTEGLLTGTKLPNNNVTAATTFANYITDFAYARVDGKWANMASDLRIVMGSSTFAHAGVTYRAAEADDIALERLMAITGGIRVSAHVPVVASHRQNSVIRLGMRRDMVVPIWDGISLIPDEITKAATGQIMVTAVMLHAIKILRTAGFRKQQTQHQ